MCFGPASASKLPATWQRPARISFAAGRPERGNVAERNLLVLHAGCREGQGVGDPAQAGVGRQNLEQGSGMAELACNARYLRLRKEQECVAFKEGSSPGLSHELEDIRPCRQ